jgi:hypothetical protein
VSRNPIQPCLTLSGIRQVFPRTVGAQERFLDQILGDGGVAR